MLESQYPPSPIKPTKEFGSSASKFVFASDSKVKSVFMSKPGSKLTSIFSKLKTGKSRNNPQSRPWSNTTDSTFMQTCDDSGFKSKPSKLKKTLKHTFGCSNSTNTPSISGDEIENPKLANPWKTNQLFHGRPFWPIVKDQEIPVSISGKNQVKDFREVIYHSDGGLVTNVKDETIYSDWHTGIVANPHLPADFSAIDQFRKLQLSNEQIIGLENLGFNFSNFVPRTNLECPADPRIPSSFEFGGAVCYWCETTEHVSFGVALLLRDDPAVVGIDLESTSRTNWNGSNTNKISLIKIAAKEVVLLIPTKTNNDEKEFMVYNSFNHSTPKALQILLRDPEIFKVGVDVEKNLLALWKDFELESNSWMELNDLIPHSCFDFADKSSTRISLNQLAARLGYRNRKIEEANLRFESLPLTWSQIHRAAEDALMTVRVFWGLMDGRVSKLMSSAEIRVTVHKFTDRSGKQLPISHLDKKQRIANLKRDLLSVRDFVEKDNSSDRKVKFSRHSFDGETCRVDSFEAVNEMRSVNCSSEKYLSNFLPWYRF